MENLKIKSIYHFNKNEIEYLTEKYQITKKEISEKTENTDNYNSKEIVKRTNKKAFIFAALAVVLAAVSIIVISNYFHTHGECGENASYKLIGNTLYIEGTGTVDGDSKDSISHFVGLSNEIKNVIISDGITEIGNFAFCDCTSLESITIPSSVTKIGDNAFYGCTSLESIKIPGSVTEIGYGAFSDCTSLESITIPSGVKKIGNRAFGGCKALKSIKIPSSVTEMGSNAFLDCDNVTIYGEAGSYAERYKKDFKFSISKNSDNSKGIVKKTDTKSVVITVVAVLAIVGAVGSIIAFGNSNSKVKNNVNSVNSAIQTNTKATKSSLDYDGQTSATETAQNIDAQGECGANASYRLIGNTLYIDGTGTVDVKTLEEGSSNYTSHFRYLPNEIENVIIADGITEVGDYAFDSCKSLKNITIPDSVIGIDNYAFYGCISLESITIPSSVNQIGEWAFDNCLITAHH